MNLRLLHASKLTNARLRIDDDDDEVSGDQRDAASDGSSSFDRLAEDWPRWARLQPSFVSEHEYLPIVARLPTLEDKLIVAVKVKVRHNVLF